MTGVGILVERSRAEVKGSTLIERVTGLNTCRSAEIKVYLAAADVIVFGNL